MALEIDFSSIEFFPLLKSKIGLARALQDVNIVNSLPHMDEIRPALFNGELRFPETDWPFLNPYPIEVSDDGKIEVQDNQLLRDLHQGLRQRDIEIVHQLIGAPKQWHPYDEAGAPMKFPAPTDLDKSAWAMRLFTERYNDTPITWTLWNEPSHNLTGEREPESVQSFLDIYEAYYKAMAPVHDKAIFGMANFIPWATVPLEALDGKSYVEAMMDEYRTREESHPTLYRDIGLERFTINNYGPRVWQLLAGCRKALGTRMNTLPLTLLQYGPFNPGQEWDENAGTTTEAVKSIHAFDGLLKVPDLETVAFSGWLGHMLQWQDGQVLELPLFNMLKLYSRMPAWRVGSSGTLPNGVGCVASADQYRACVMLWNDSTEPCTLDLNLINLPQKFRAGTTQVSIYRIDANHGSPLEGSDKKFGPTEVATINSDSDSLSRSVTVEGPGITYIEVDGGEGNPSLDRKGLHTATFLRKYSYSDRFTDDEGTIQVRDSYGAYDAVRATAYTGVKNRVGRGICGAEYDNLPDKLSVDIVAHKMSPKPIVRESIFGIRVDYVTNGTSVKSVLWHGDIFSADRTEELPWGKGSATADVLIEARAIDSSYAGNGRLVLDLKKYAPINWVPSGRRAIISFWTESTGEGSQAMFLLEEVPRPEIRTQVLDQLALSDQMPVSYDPGGAGLPAQSFEVAATFENAGSPDSRAILIKDLDLHVTGIPDGWTATSLDRTHFGAIAQGESVTAT
ncbi:hypothetical protein [Jiangella asiatica]|uniref:Uncharacterized protein n=1 Tax=Jiangella asiatica TaxID=2530372 RepID=A0A4R5D960_9ACTN|nr:hypothetical protein [Jiangella asiatica]TDE09277.1 hypothetical protein E1269_14785 [Jiangella asiatica]